uniref:Uncharacterized protein n=1 Tax=viral metagenome TaxID=1070528 RepID=A0A6C0D225_9ZZZZ
MTNQIFKQLVPKELLFDLLEKICLKTDKYFLFDNNAYRKMLFYKHHETFLESLKEYYHLGKQNYIQRKIAYNGFTTILRQICKSSNIMYTSQIKYNESKYNIDYFVFF